MASLLQGKSKFPRGAIFGVCFSHTSLCKLPLVNLYSFYKSLAAYSIVTYLLQVKDRHNGNILLDNVGHIIHIDFGFMLSNSPGRNSNFESAPFKLTNEYIKIMGGPRSSTFRLFRAACVKAFQAARENMERIILLVEMMLVGNEKLPCFLAGRDTIKLLRERFMPDLSPAQVPAFVHNLIENSNDQWRTRFYDSYQYCCNNVW